MENLSLKTWYHGGARGLTRDRIDPLRYSGNQNIYGLGLYMTDDPSVASAFSEMGQKRSIYQASISPSKALNLEGPIPSDVSRLIEQTQGYVSGSTAGEAIQNAVHRQPRSIQKNLASGLRNLGYDVLHHTAPSGAGRQNIAILLDKGPIKSLNPAVQASNFRKSFGRTPLRSAVGSKDASIARNVARGLKKVL